MTAVRMAVSPLCYGVKGAIHEEACNKCRVSWIFSQSWTVHLHVQAAVYLAHNIQICTPLRPMPTPRETLERPTRSSRNSRLLHHTPTAPSPNTRPSPRRRRSSQSARSTRSLHNRPPNSRPHTDFDLLPPSSRIIALLFARFLSGGTLAVGSHLGLDFHALVEL